MLNKGTADKIEIVGDNFLPALRKCMPDSSIPRFLGGSCDCADADKECCSTITVGGMVPLDALDVCRKSYAASHAPAE